MKTTNDDGLREPLWNSLEVCKLIVGLAIPLTILIAGHWYTETEDSWKSDLEHKRAQEEERE